MGRLKADSGGGTGQSGDSVRDKKMVSEEVLPSENSIRSKTNKAPEFSEEFTEKIRKVMQRHDGTLRKLKNR